MKWFLYLVLIFTTLGRGLELAKQIRKNIHASLQENAPDFYVRKWCNKNVDSGDLVDAIKNGRNGVLKSAFSLNPLLVENFSLLFSAIEANNCLAVQELLTRGASVNCVDEKDMSPIEYALENTDRDGSFIAGLLLSRKSPLTKNLFSVVKKRYKPEQVSYIADLLRYYNREAAISAIPGLVADSDEFFLIPWVQKDSELASKTFEEILKLDKKELLRSIFLGPDYKKKVAFSNRLTQDQAQQLFSNYSFGVVRAFLTDEQIVIEAIRGTKKDKSLTSDSGEVSQIVEYMAKRPNLTMEQRRGLCRPFLSDKQGAVNLFASVKNRAKHLFGVQDVGYALKIEDKEYLQFLYDVDSGLFAKPLYANTSVLMQMVLDNKLNIGNVLASDEIKSTLENRSIGNQTALSCAIEAENHEAMVSVLSNGAHLLVDFRAMDSLCYSPQAQEIASEYFGHIESLYHDTFLLMNDWLVIKGKIQKLTANELQLCPAANPLERKIITEDDNLMSLLEKKISLMENSPSFSQFTTLVYDTDSNFRIISSIKKFNHHLRTKVIKASEFLKRDQKCAICFDEDPQKPHVLVCKNSHRVCLICYGNPALDKCPLCRDQFPVDKLSLCQSCQTNQASTKLFYCASCDHTAVICKNCLAFPCCKASLDMHSVQLMLSCVKASEFGQKYLSNFQDRSQAEYQLFEKKKAQEIEKAQSVLKAKLDSLNSQMQQYKAEIEQKKSEIARLKASYDKAKSAYEKYLLKKAEEEKRECEFAQRAGVYSFSLGFDFLGREKKLEDNLESAVEVHNACLREIECLVDKHNKLVGDARVQASSMQERIVALSNELNSKKESFEIRLRELVKRLERMKNI